MRKIKPCREVKHGNIRFTVRIPQSLRAEYGCSKKSYSNKTDAQECADTINNGRAAWTQQVAALPNETNGRLLRCLDLVGGDVANLEAAITVWQRTTRNAKTAKLITDAVAECLRERERMGCSENHIGHMRSRLVAFAANPEIKHVHEVTADQCRSFINNPSWSTNTRINAHNMLKAFFTWAKKQGYVNEPPMDGIGRASKPQIHIGILTVDQAKEALRVAYETDRGLLSFVAIGLFAGIRVAEMERMTPDLLTQGAYIPLHGSITKTGFRRLVEVMPVLRQWLDISSETKWAGLEHRVRAFHKLLSFPWPKNAMRHSFCSYALALPDWGPTRASKSAGNSESIIEREYKQLVTPGAAGAYFGLTPDVVLGSGWRAANVVPMSTGPDKSCQAPTPAVVSADEAQG